MGSHKLPKAKPEIDREEWRVIKDFEDYEVSSLSRVRSIKMQHYVHIGTNKSGYLVVYLQERQRKLKLNYIYIGLFL